ncbi:DUF6458 family protein [Actinopolymorpha pittospori]|jgi:membrane protein implicated in regulation of membrane protease activity|uniref:Membrane protein implicated in regulation of membrane protease activity n=1 Tax=Actinopolymorpha pittospori TaxID=648752 RepID=A0A927MU00_9ACTN|nr:DUF6458 family protein [Actinopolymorpha pittospori]MBE1606164.1 membrane protein implicated in regulation of membrane protease activity [Actinopolymorpha pittospori]
MSIGAGIFFIAFGAILAFAVRAQPDWLRVDVVGWVFILTGITILAITLSLWSKRRRSATVSERQVLENGRQTTTERRVYHETDVPPEV